MVKLKEKVPGVQSSQSSARDSTGDEHKNKSSNKFPLQRGIHCENSSWMALSAMANSFVRSLYRSLLCLTSRAAAAAEITITAADRKATRRSSDVTPFRFGIAACHIVDKRD